MHRTAQEIADHLIAEEPERVRALLTGLVIDYAYLTLKDHWSHEDNYEVTESLLLKLETVYRDEDEAKAILAAAGIPDPTKD